MIRRTWGIIYRHCRRGEDCGGFEIKRGSRLDVRKATQWHLKAVLWPWYKTGMLKLQACISKTPTTEVYSRRLRNRVRHPGSIEWPRLGTEASKTSSTHTVHVPHGSHLRQQEQQAVRQPTTVGLLVQREIRLRDQRQQLLAARHLRVQNEGLGFRHPHVGAPQHHWNAERESMRENMRQKCSWMTEDGRVPSLKSSLTAVPVLSIARGSPTWCSGSRSPYAACWSTP